MSKKYREHKAVIETLLNTIAIAVTGTGVIWVTTKGEGWNIILQGIVLISFGAGLEFFKYLGRNKKLW
jgi:hypothetical protein